MARKKRYTRLVGVMFSDDTYNGLVEITDEQELSISEFIRETVEDKLEQLNR